MCLKDVGGWIAHTPLSKITGADPPPPRLLAPREPHHLPPRGRGRIRPFPPRVRGVIAGMCVLLCVYEKRETSSSKHVKLRPPSVSSACDVCLFSSLRLGYDDCGSTSVGYVSFVCHARMR